MANLMAIAYSHVQQNWSSIHIYLGLCSWPCGLYKSSIQVYSTVRSVLVPTNFDYVLQSLVTFSSKELSSTNGSLLCQKQVCRDQLELTKQMNCRQRSNVVILLQFTDYTCFIWSCLYYASFLCNDKSLLNMRVCFPLPLSKVI